MAIPKTPHTQTEQNTRPEQSDLEADERVYETDSPADQKIYSNADGAETGTNRSPRQTEMRNRRRRMEPEVEAHEGPVDTRTPGRSSQGITSHSAEEESERQKKVVKERPDAQAGLNRSRRRSKKAA